MRTLVFLCLSASLGSVVAVAQPACASLNGGNPTVQDFLSASSSGGCTIGPLTFRASSYTAVLGYPAANQVLFTPTIDANGAGFTLSPSSYGASSGRVNYIELQYVAFTTDHSASISTFYQSISGTEAGSSFDALTDNYCTLYPYDTSSPPSCSPVSQGVVTLKNGAVTQSGTSTFAGTNAISVLTGMQACSLPGMSSGFLTCNSGTLLLNGGPTTITQVKNQFSVAVPLQFFKNYFVTGDYAVAGVGLRGTGVGGVATGQINFAGVPAGADIVAAFLYWETEESAPSPASANGFFDGNAIVGKVLGSATNPACIAGMVPGASARVYRADVLRYLPIDSTTSVHLANGPHTVKLPDTGPALSGNVALTDGATLVVIYRILTPGTPLRAVILYDGSYTASGSSGSLSQTIAGFYQAAATPAAKITEIVANGQPSIGQATLTVNGSIVQVAPFTGALGGRWDSPTYNINLAQNAASFGTQVTGLNTPDCLTWASIITSTLVTDSDQDGLLDVWETKGIHLNDQISPPTFGGCADYPAEPCVNLPAMGANPAVQDIFTQIDWEQGSDGHLHIPKLQALTMIGDRFASHGIQIHFDVGNNYQGSKYIVPAAYAQGGQVIQESTLLCPNAVTSTCTFPGLPYAVQSWKIGFAAVKNGFPALGIPAHFAENRKDSFHYVLFGHALAIPYSPSTGFPKSTSGVADHPGGDVMVTLGLWLSDTPGDNQTGSYLQQAGTLMHELGHNLGLSHAGLFQTPNCMPNYPSVMNYLYQARGLDDQNGNPQVDYSSGTLPGLNENALFANALGNTPPYRIRYYAPLGAFGSAATLHCDGTPITNGATEIRLESAGGPIDWQDNGSFAAGPFSIDTNFNGTTGDPVNDSVDSQKPATDPTKRWFVDSNDWGNLNLAQIGARANIDGLSADVGQADFGQADFGQADFGQADFGQADFGSQNLGQADFGDVNYDTVISTLDATSSGQPLQAASSLTNIVLTWGQPSIGQIRHYNIYRSDPSHLTPTLIAHVDGAPPATTWTDTVDSVNTLYNVTYTYFIVTVDINGTQSAPSGTVNGIVKHLFITANNKQRYYGDPNPVFDFTTTGLDPGLSGATVCTTTATQTSNVGTYPITCSGRTPAAGVTYTNGTLTVNPAPLTLTAVTNTKVFDGTTSAAAIPTVSGLKNSDAVAGLAETYDTPLAGTGKTLSVSPGYTVNDNNSGKNYSVSTVPNSTGVITAAVTGPIYEYDFYIQGTKTIGLAFQYSAILRDYSPVNIPIPGFSGFIAPSPLSINPCTMASGGSAQLYCVGSASHGGWFSFQFDYGAFPRQVGPFTGSGQVGVDRSTPSAGIINLLNGVIRQIQ